MTDHQNHGPAADPGGELPGRTGFTGTPSFAGRVLAWHADGTPCIQYGAGRHKQKPIDPRCPGRVGYTAECQMRGCGWITAARARTTVKARTKIHALWHDDQLISAEDVYVHGFTLDTLESLGFYDPPNKSAPQRP